MSPATLPESSIQRILRPHLKALQSWEELLPDSDLEAAGLDATGSIDLIVQLEEELGMTIPDSVISPESFATLRGLRALLDRLHHRAG